MEVLDRRVASFAPRVYIYISRLNVDSPHSPIHFITRLNLISVIILRRPRESYKRAVSPRPIAIYSASRSLSNLDFRKWRIQPSLHRALGQAVQAGPPRVPRMIHIQAGL